MKRFLSFSWGALLACTMTCLFSTAVQAQIVITEVMYDATVDDVWEWIEITNTGASAVNMDNYFAFNLGDTDLATPSPSILSSLGGDAVHTTINPGETMIIYDAFYASGNINNFNTATQFRSAWNMAPTTKVLGAQFWPAMANTPGGQQQSIGFWPTVEAWRADQTSGVTTSFANAAFSLNFANFPVTANVNGHSSITWTGNGSSQDGANWVQSVTGVNGAVTSTVATIGTGSDVGNPGIISNLGTPSPGLYFTEIMYDPSTDTSAPLGEWVELFNNTGSDLNLAGYVLDDNNSVAHTQANIASGIIPNGEVGILFNGDLQSPAEFEAVWGAGLTLIPVTNWPANTLNNTGDVIGLWSSFGSYSGNHQTLANAVTTQSFLENAGFPNAINASITLGSLDNDAFPRDSSSSWVTSAVGDSFGSFVNSLRHPGGDVGSPGTFVTAPGGIPGDFDGDGDVDGRDFLVWQRGGSPNAYSPADLAEWQTAYNGGALSGLNAVPEPSSLLILALALAPIACGRKR